jgi:hypothetical protein
LWISPELVHCCGYYGPTTEFAAKMIRFDQQSAAKKANPREKKPLRISTKKILPPASAAFCIERCAITNRIMDAVRAKTPGSLHLASEIWDTTNPTRTP